MAAEIEYINYKEFVEGLSTTENLGVTDKTVVSNSTDGPRAVPANTSALSNTATDSDLTADASFELQTATGKKKVPANLLAKQSALETTNGNVTALTTYAQFYAETQAFCRGGVSKLVARAGIILEGGTGGGSLPNYAHAILLVKPSESVKITAKSNAVAHYAFLKTYSSISSFTYATGYTTRVVIYNGSTANVDAPEDANYLYVALAVGGTDLSPANIELDGERTLDKVEEQIDGNSEFIDNFVKIEYTEVTGKFISTDGSEASLSGYNSTDYVRVNPGVKLDINNVYLQANSSFAFYDSDKKFVSILDETGISNLSRAHIQITIPNGCYYVRWTHLDTYTSTAKVVSKLDDFVLKSVAAVENEFGEFLDVPYSYVTGKYIYTDGTEATLSGYNSTGFVFVTPGAILDITHVFLNANGSFAFYDRDKKFVGILDETGIPRLANAHIKVTMPNGCYYVRWSYKDTYTSVAKIKVKLDPFVFGAMESVRLSVLPPLATLVDDDSFLDYIPNIKSACDANGIKCSFAVIWTKLQNDSTLLNLLKSYQEDGYNIIDHPQGPNWGTNAETFNLANAEQMLVQSLIYLQSQGFLDCDHFVAPGGYVTTEMLEMVSKWCKSGIGRNNGHPNHLNQDGKYNLHRLFIGEHDTDILADYTSTIDSAYAKKDWLILGCHSYNINTPEKIQLLSDVIAYAKTKGFVFKTYNKAFKDRQYYFDLPQLIPGAAYT